MVELVGTGPRGVHRRRSSVAQPWFSDPIAADDAGVSRMLLARLTTSNDQIADYMEGCCVR